MKIAVLGTGTVGRTIAGALSRTWATTSSSAPATRRRRWPGPSLAPWEPRLSPSGTRRTAESAIGTFADAAARADVVVNATNGAGSLAALTAAGAENLGGKVLMDIANPLDFSHGFPPSLNPVNTDSLGEQIQRAFPEARVVKTLNTMTASVMVDPASVAGGDHSVFVSGNDADAKEAVAGLLTDLGHRDIIDLGDITTARGAEMILPIWLRVWGALGTGVFNFKVAR